MSEKMSPVEIMAQAFDEAKFEPWPEMTRKQEVVIRMRAALRALAEMEPTKAMIDSACREQIPGRFELVAKISKAYIRAAAEGDGA